MLLYELFEGYQTHCTTFTNTLKAVEEFINDYTYNDNRNLKKIEPEDDYVELSRFINNLKRWRHKTSFSVCIMLDSGIIDRYNNVIHKSNILLGK